MSSNSTRNDMLVGSIWDKLLWFAIPLALTNIMQQLFNAADIAIVGQFVGKHALAAVGANGVVVNLFLNLFVGLSIGTNVLISTLVGRKDDRRVSAAVHTSLAIAVVSGIVLALLGLVCSRQILILLSTPTEILDDAVLYLKIICLGMPFLLCFNFASAILRSVGDSKTSMWVMCITGFVNVILNLLFVLCLDMTVDGVAFATILSTALGAYILIRVLVRSKGSVRLHYKQIRFHRTELKFIAKIGVPAGVQGMMFSFSNICIQFAMNQLGYEYIAASAAALNYEFLAYFLLNSFAMATVTFIGVNYGALQFDRCKKIVRLSLIMDGCVTVVFSVIVVVFAELCMLLYTTDSVLIEHGVLRLRYILSFELLNVFIEVLSGALRGIGISLMPAVICFFGICCFRVLWVYAVFENYKSFSVLMMAYPISWIITFIFLSVFYWHIGKNKFNQKHTITEAG